MVYDFRVLWDHRYGTFPFRWMPSPSAKVLEVLNVGDVVGLRLPRIETRSKELEIMNWTRKRWVRARKTYNRTRRNFPKALVTGRTIEMRGDASDCLLDCVVVGTWKDDVASVLESTLVVHPPQWFEND